MNEGARGVIPGGIYQGSQPVSGYRKLGVGRKTSEFLYEHAFLRFLVVFHWNLVAHGSLP